MKITEFLKQSKGVEFDYLGTTRTAYPLSAGCIFKLKNVAPHISKVLSVVFEKTEGDSSHKYASYKDGDTQSVENSSEAVSPEIIQIRTRQKTEAIQGIVDFFLSDESSELLIDVLWSGLRLGSEKPKTEAERSEILADMTVEELSAMLQGIFKANKKVLGPFSDTLTRISESAKELVDQKLQKEVPDQEQTDGKK